MSRDKKCFECGLQQNIDNTICLECRSAKLGIVNTNQEWTNEEEY